MNDIVKGRSLDAESRRALQLDTLAAILPMDRRDRLAQLLTATPWPATEALR